MTEKTQSENTCPKSIKNISTGNINSFLKQATKAEPLKLFKMLVNFMTQHCLVISQEIRVNKSLHVFSVTVVHKNNEETISEIHNKNKVIMQDLC